MTNSALYRGWVTHRRRGPVRHGFRYPIVMPLFDLDEVPEVLDSIPLWSARRPAPARLRCSDFLGGGSGLAERARVLVLSHVGRRPAGPVRLLANPRFLGVGFNPVSFLFLHGADGGLEAVIAEVTNTPWGERHAYVLDGESRDPDGAVRATLVKRLHVSPFQSMDQSYEISVDERGEELRVTIRSLEDGGEVFTVTMALRRHEMTKDAMVGVLMRHPPSTIATLGRIYANALRLRLKGATTHPHPGRATGMSAGGLSRSVVHGVLARIRSGRIELREGWSSRRKLFGPGAAGLSAEIEVHDPGFYDALARRRSIGLGESYAEGLWDTPDIVALLRIGAREMFRLDRARRLLAPLARPLHRLAMLPLLNTVGGARRNIAAHYDLGNEMFETFLDSESMMYSSACFEHRGQSLEEAQQNKLERICAALELGPEDHVLEIGTGWGGFAIHAAREHGCRVTTTTVSSRQREHAEARVRSAGLESRVTVLGEDYRTLRGRFDKLVSIEMIEAVGWEYLDLFFRRCSELLEPDGLMFLQAICVDDRAFQAEKATRSFANQLIFPGGCLPSVERIHRCLASETDMRDVWLEDISASYALTLRAWRERFTAASSRLADLGYESPFRRLWELYFALSEAGFLEARLSDVQMLCAKRGWQARVPSPAERPAATEPGHLILDQGG